MRRLVQTSLASLALVLLVLLVAATVATALEQSGHTFRGQMVDHDTGTPIEGNVTVFMLHAGRLESETKAANGDGWFELSLPVLPYRALLQADGYAPQQIEDPDSGSTVRLDRFKTLSGTVKDSEGSAVEHAVVWASYDEDEGYVPGWMADSLAEQRPMTNVDGMFVLDDIVPGRTLWIQAGHLDGSRNDGAVSTPQLSGIASVRVARDPAEAEPVQLTLQP